MPDADVEREKCMSKAAFKKAAAETTDLSWDLIVNYMRTVSNHLLH